MSARSSADNWLRAVSIAVCASPASTLSSGRSGSRRSAISGTAVARRAAVLMWEVTTLRAVTMPYGSTVSGASRPCAPSRRSRQSCTRSSMSDGFATRAATTRRMTGSIASTSSADDTNAASSTMSRLHRCGCRNAGLPGFESSIIRNAGNADESACVTHSGTGRFGSDSQRSTSVKDCLVPLSISYSQGLTSAWSNIATFVPKLVAFLIIVIVGYIIAKIISKILAKVLQRVGFDRLVERGGIRKALASSKYDAAEILARLVFYAIMLFVLSTGFGVFGSNPVSNYLHAVIAYLPLIFVAILIVIIAAAVAAGAKTLIQNSLGGLSYAPVLANAAAAVIIALGVVAALDQLHIAAAVVNAVLYAVLAAA